MGPRLLCFAAGAAASTFFIHMGLLATPFFGAGAFLWASVFASFLLSMALGFGLGDLLAVAAGRRDMERSAPRLALAGGLTSWAAAYSLPDLARAVLERDPEWSLAPAVTMAALTLLPGALIAAISPSELRARLGETDSHGAARSALRLIGLMSLGSAAGALLSAQSLLRAEEVDVYLRAYVAGGALAALALPQLGGLGRAVGAVLLATLLGVSIALPSEVQSSQFAVAVEMESERSGAALYYRRTAHQDEALSAAELEERYRKVAGEVGTEKAGIILTLEMLQALGEVNGVTGDGLCKTLELLLPPDARPFVLPIFEQVESIRADRDGLLHFVIRRTRGENGARFKIPAGEPGKWVEFLLADDFTIHMLHEGNVWKLEFGPITTVRAGVFELNDTRRSPIEIENVALWIDASLLGLVLEDYPDQVVVKAVAQGSIGAVQTVEVIAMPKERKPADPRRPGR